MKDVFQEEMLKYQDLCSFEGNAQALRLLAKLPLIDTDYGMNLANVVLNMIIKYPCSSREKDEDSNDIKYHKMGYFQGGRENFEKVCKDTGTYDGDHF